MKPSMKSELSGFMYLPKALTGNMNFLGILQMHRPYSFWTLAI